MNQVEAYELTQTVHEMFIQIVNEAKQKRITFDECLELKQFDKLTLRETSILNNIKPYCDLKQLVSNINMFSGDVNALEAFIEAIESYDVMRLEK